MRFDRCGPGPRNRRKVMPLDAYRPDLKIGIAGTGIMGQGIAQIAAAAGMQAVLFDARAGAADTACRQIADVFKRLADKGKLSAEAAAANTQRLSVAADALDLRACDVVVEAIVEDLNTKKALFAELEHIVGGGQNVLAIVDHQQPD